MMVQAATVRIVLNQRRVFDSSLGITSQARSLAETLAPLLWIL